MLTHQKLRNSNKLKMRISAAVRYMSTYSYHLNRMMDVQIRFQYLFSVIYASSLMRVTLITSRGALCHTWFHLVYPHKS